jgi:hypothetical protein
MPEDIPAPEEPEAAEMIEGLWVKTVVCGKSLGGWKFGI